MSWFNTRAAGPDGRKSVWTGLFSRRDVKLSNRDDAETLRQALAMAGGSAAGKAITIDTVLQLSTAWACMRLLSTTIGTLPLQIFERVGDNERRLARNEPLYDLLHSSPNADQTAVEFWEGQIACLCGWGNAYAEKEMTSGKRVVALTPLKPDHMTVTRRNGRRMYLYDDPGGGRRRDLDEDKVFHLRGFGFGGDAGLSPVSYARQTFGIALAADETAAATFANGLQNSGFIHLPVGMKPPTKEQKEQLIDFFGKFAGSSRAGKMLPLDPGMEFKPLGLNPDDAQLLQSRAFNVEEICRFYGVPPHMVGHTAKSTSWGTGLEQQGLTFKTYVINTYLCRIEQAIWKQLIPPGDRARLFAEFNLDGLLRADSAARGELYWKLFQLGAIDANWIAGKENIPMSASGNRRYINSTLAPIDETGMPLAPARPVQPAPGEPALEAAA